MGTYKAAQPDIRTVETFCNARIDSKEYYML
jgi:4'-phosphopantetheinyl transferase EntD